MTITEFVATFAVNFFHILASIAPYFLVGLLIAGLIKTLIPQEKLATHLGASKVSAIFKAAALGVPLPLCSCSVLPVALSLARHGAGLPATVAFLVATPQTSIDALFITFGLFGLPFAVSYALAALTAGIAAGFISFLVLRDKKISLAPEDLSPCCAQNRSSPLREALHYSFGDLMAELARPLAIGLILAALLVTILPPGYLGQKVSPGFWQYLVMLLTGVPLYMCSTGSLPLAYSFYLQGFSPGSLLVFLMSGPATNVASLVIIRKIFGTKTFAVYALSLIGFSIIAGIILDFLWQEGSFVFKPPVDRGAHLSVLNVLAAAVLGTLIIMHLLKSYFRRAKTCTCKS